MIARIVLVLSLGVDTLAIALAMGMAGLPRSVWLRAALVVGAVEGGMPLLGIILGRAASTRWESAVECGAGVLLLILGCRELYEVASGDDESEEAERIERAAQGSLLTLIVAGLAVSMDELVVGVAMGAAHTGYALTLAYIPVQAFAATFIGLALGRRAGERMGRAAELFAGLLLAGLGAYMLIARLTGHRLFGA